MKPSTLRNALTGKLTPAELYFLTTSYDIMGNVIIIDIPPELIKRQAVIGKTLLQMHKNVTTVCKRVGIHSGVFRTQKVKVIAGKKTKEATHRENNVSLTLDVEKVYYSARSSSERQRVASLVKPGESVLVMFAGCAPFVCVIAKNTQVKEVFGIEINPTGHYYGQLNIKNNKIHNASLILGDVRKVVPDFYKYCIGLKSSIDNSELIKRLTKNPGILELHLFDKDLFTLSRYKKVERTIALLQKKGVEVILHQPLGYKDGSGFNFGKEILDKEYELVKKMGALCKKYHCKAVMHPYTQGEKPKSTQQLIKNLQKFKRYMKYFMFENVKSPPFHTAKNIVKIGKKAGIQNMVVDLAHYMILNKSTTKVVNEIKIIQKNFNTYFHVSDSDGKQEAMTIGTGNLQFKKILPYINKGIIEVRSKDENHPREMLSSYNKIAKLHKTFDRIIMPLPKGAEKFLDTALLASKKGTIIHFYDFLQLDDFASATEKVSLACKKAKKKFKILRFTKCGSYSPRVYRVCVDVQIL